MTFHWQLKILLATWRIVKYIINRNSFTLNYVNFWGHSDADMLEVGNGGLTLAEERTHFSLWAAMKSPLLMGTDLAQLRPASIEILKNKYLLAFNQDDVVGEPAKPYKWSTNPNWTFNDTHPPEYWSGKSKQGVFSLIINVAETRVIRRVVFSQVPELKANGTYRVIEVWDGKDKGCFSNGFDVDIGMHDTSVLILKNDCGGNLRIRRDLSK
jgi:alpha-galactosidase